MADTTAALSPPGALYEQAAQFGSDLAAMQTAAADQMLAAHAQVYAQVRVEYDALIQKVAEAQAANKPTSPAWLYQKARLKEALGTTKVEIARFAAEASAQAKQAQYAAVQASVKHAAKMGQQAVQQAGVNASFLTINPENLEHLVGFLQDGSPLDHLFASMGAETAEQIRSALVRGIILGKGPAWMTRQVETALDVPRWRAETIMRTESQRVYRSVARSTYMANAGVLTGWTWVATLDGRVCPACLIMDGTEHPVTALLDGHPRCRCAMVPRTKTYDEILGDPPGTTPDSRPPVRSGKAWLEGQSANVQRAMLGAGKWKAWKAGKITLDDMVGRSHSDQWGTMRRERSLREISEGLYENYPDTPPPPPAPVEYQPQRKAAVALAAQESLASLEDLVDLAEGQELANAKAALALALNAQDYTVAMPQADEAKAAKATGKMNAAVLSKGYPSKGYSQTVAIYKAQANGTVGGKVGVIASLTWEQKITSQSALNMHADWLKDHLEKQVQAKGEGQGIVTALELGLDVAEDQDDALESIKAAKSALQDLPAGPEKDRAAAYVDAMADAYGQAAGNVLEIAQQGTDWHNADGALLALGNDGWGLITYPSGSSQTTPPQSTFTLLTSGDWTHTVEPDPVQVSKILVDMVTPEGYLDLDWAKVIQGIVDSPTAKTQDKVDSAEALNQANALYGWPPEPDDQNNTWMILKALPPGPATQTTLDALQKAIADDTFVDTPGVPKQQAKANAIQALKNLEDQKAAQALASAQPTAYGIPKDPTWPSPTATSVQAKLDLLKQYGDEYVGYFKSDLQGSAMTGAGNASTWEALHLYETGQSPTAPKVWGQHEKDVVAWLSEWESGKADVWEMASDGSPAGTEAASVAKTYEDSTADLGPSAVTYYAKTKGFQDEDDAEASAAQGLVPAVAAPAPAGPPPGPFGAPPSPGDLTNTGQVLGTHGAQVWKDAQGNRYLFKPPKNSADAFLVTLDEAASLLQAKAGLKAPDTWTMTLGGQYGSLQRMFDATQAFDQGFKPQALTGDDLLAVQQQQVLDWLLANHDGHVEQFLRLPTGELVGIDKGQAFRWMGMDRLDWDFHPNGYYGAPPPVYNALWGDFAKGGSGEVLDPRTGPLGDFIANLQGMSDDDLKALFRPYAQEAAARSLLAAKGQPQPGLVTGTIPSNDPEAFLDALVARKNALADDFADLYDRAAAKRKAALPDWKPTKPTPTAAQKKAAKVKALIGSPEPKAPKPPDSPLLVHKPLFTGWLAKAEARYQANPAKAKANLQATANWTRFERVIDLLDRGAVQELLDRKYLDQAMADEALDLISQAEAKRVAAQAAFAKKQAAYERAQKKYGKDLTAWREANGIVFTTRGMDEGVLRHDTDEAGVRWADSQFSESKWTQAQRQALRTYTGGTYSVWNGQLRNTQGDPGQYKPTLDKVDAAMPIQPMTEDVILHRGTGSAAFDFGDGRRSDSRTQDLQNLVGSVQVEHGYLSASVGNSAAFDSYDVQIKFRAPKGTRGAYVKAFSNFSREREVILARGLNYYVHAVYKAGSKWIMEAEIVDADFQPPLDTSGAPVVRPSTRKWDH